MQALGSPIGAAGAARWVHGDDVVVGSPSQGRLASHTVRAAQSVSDAPATVAWDPAMFKEAAPHFTRRNTDGARARKSRRRPRVGTGKTRLQQMKGEVDAYDACVEDNGEDSIRNAIREAEVEARSPLTPLAVSAEWAAEGIPRCHPRARRLRPGAEREPTSEDDAVSASTVSINGYDREDSTELNMQQLDEYLQKDGFWPAAPGNFELNGQWSEKQSQNRDVSRERPYLAAVDNLRKIAGAGTDLMFDLEL